jgi:hypothetical protein
MMRTLADITDRRQCETVERGLAYGLEAAPSVQDRRISTFARGHQPAFAGVNDVSDMTAQLGCPAVMDVLGTLVDEGKLGRRVTVGAAASTESEGA